MDAVKHSHPIDIPDARFEIFMAMKMEAALNVGEILTLPTFMSR
jgi:hypothetical protein